MVDGVVLRRSRTTAPSEQHEEVRLPRQRAAATVRELRQMGAHLGAAVDAADDAQRDVELAAGIVAWGHEFVELVVELTADAPDAALRSRCLALTTAWCGGERLTDRVDEDERRALFLLRTVEVSSELARLAVVALLELPREHPLRQASLPPLLGDLARRLDDTADDADHRLALAQTLLVAVRQGETAVDPDALLLTGERLLPHVERDGVVSGFRITGAGHLASRAVQARDAADRDRQERLSAQARQLLAPVLHDADGALQEGYPAVLAGLLEELDERPAQALEHYLRAVDGELEPWERRPALSSLVRAAHGAGRHDVVRARAVEAVDLAVQDYVREPDPDRADQRRDALNGVLETVCRSCAAARDAELLLEVVERASSARLRHRLALRRGRTGRRLRAVESALWSAERGLADLAERSPTARAATREGRAARQVSVVARLREARRRAYADAEVDLSVPSAGELAQRLGTGEAVAVLASGGWGTAALLVTQGSSPVAAVWAPESLAQWASVLHDDDGTGWAQVLASPWADAGAGAPALRRDLDRVLSFADAHLATQLGRLAEEHRVRRLWLVPHGMLALVPWSCAPSLDHLDLRPAPSTALLPLGRGAARLGRRAVVVGDPTGDLPAAGAEALAVASRLQGRGMPVDVLTAEQSTESAVQERTRGADVLHVAGHAVSDLVAAERSALQLRPDEPWPRRADAVVRSLAAQADWQEGDGERTADVVLDPPGGRTRARLREQRPRDGLVVRHLEHSATGTLLTVHDGERLVRLAELWSAGDMAVSSALRSVRLAVLSACQSGGGGLAVGADEFAGLPAALTLAGVRTVVCTAWTVDDVLAALSADLLWEVLCSRRSGTVDVYDVVAQVRRTLRGLTATEAGARVERLRAGASRPRTRFQLEAAGARLRAGPAQPFAHPFDWGSLFVVGAAHVRWKVP